MAASRASLRLQLTLPFPVPVPVLVLEPLAAQGGRPGFSDGSRVSMALTSACSHEEKMATYRTEVSATAVG